MQHDRALSTWLVAAINNEGTIIINNSVFTDNFTADINSGSAIFVDASQGGTHTNNVSASRNYFAGNGQKGVSP